MLTCLLQYKGGDLSCVEIVEQIRIALTRNALPALFSWAYPGLMEDRDGAEGFLMGLAKALMLSGAGECPSVGEVREALEALRARVGAVQVAAAAGAVVGAAQPEKEEQEALVLTAEGAGRGDDCLQQDQQQQGPQPSEQQQLQLKAAT